MNNRTFERFLTYSKFLGLHRRSQKALSDCKGALEGQTVFILGTGPSVARTPLDKLAGQNVIFLNNAATLTSRFLPGWQALVVTDYLRMQESRHVFSEFDGLKVCSTDRIFDPFVDQDLFKAPFSFVMPKHLSHASSSSVNMRILNPGGFSEDLSDGLYLGYTVVFSGIQLAYHLGARRIVLAGIDMDYSPKAGAYFDKTITDNWPTFDYAIHARDHFIEVFNKLKSLQVDLINGTVGGAIDVLPRQSIEEVLS